MTFEESMTRLDLITQEMGKEDIPLDKSLELYQEATNLIVKCKEYIENAKLKITELENN